MHAVSMTACKVHAGPLTPHAKPPHAQSTNDRLWQPLNGLAIKNIDVHEVSYPKNIQI
jgi:hypothetical protein